MRPRVFPADDLDSGIFPNALGSTSMRPRVFPADDALPEPSKGMPPVHFNEAAGIPRGRP